MKGSITLSVIVGLCAVSTSACKQDQPMLTRQVFEQAVKTCHPLDAKFTLYTDPSRAPVVEITVPETPSTIADCMARALDGYRFEVLRITIERQQAAEVRNSLAQSRTRN